MAFLSYSLFLSWTDTPSIEITLNSILPILIKSPGYSLHPKDYVGEFLDSVRMMKYGSIVWRFCNSSKLFLRYGTWFWTDSGFIYRLLLSGYSVWICRFSTYSVNSIFLVPLNSLFLLIIFTWLLSSSKEYTLIVNWLVIEFITNLNAHKNSLSNNFYSLGGFYFDWGKWRPKAAILTSLSKLFSYTTFLSLVLKINRKQSSSLGSITLLPETKLIWDLTFSSMMMVDFSFLSFS